MRMDEITTANGCVALLRSLPERMEGFGKDNALVVFNPWKMAEVLETASKRDADDEDETLVKRCATCRYWIRTILCGKRTKGGLCKVRDSLTTEEFGNDCRQFECRFLRKSGGEQ